jgi:hypothetical protein
VVSAAGGGAGIAHDCGGGVVLGRAEGVFLERERERESVCVCQSNRDSE